MKSAIEAVLERLSLSKHVGDERIEEARAELAELLGYVRHAEPCHKHIRQHYECTCGLDKLLERFKGGE